jgi:hypothetical protein
MLKAVSVVLGTDVQVRQQSANSVEKVERQQFRVASDVQPLHDRSIAAVLVSPGRKNFCPRVNVVEFFNRIGRFLPVAPASRFSTGHPCYSGPNGRVRPRADIGCFSR